MNGATNSLELDAARVPPKLASPAKPIPALFAVGALAFIAAVAFLFWFDPAQYRFYPFCFFHQLTGLHCPGCGGTRALHQLLHGHLTAALHLNALLVLTLPLLGWLGGRFVIRKIKQQPAVRMVSPGWFWVFLAVCAVFTLLRNLPAGAWLAP